MNFIPPPPPRLQRGRPPRMHASSCRCIRCNHAAPGDSRPRGCAAAGGLAFAGIALGFALTALAAAAHGSTVLVIFGVTQ